LETFRLPGESQQIDRITETFAEVFIESKPAEVANQEAAFVLAFSVIMLNTDQHNRQVRVSTSTSFKLLLHVSHFIPKASHVF
jgi:brefeldin A-resistance guanine nucleotide exchange factor 1